MVNIDALNSIRAELPESVTLVAVSKTKPIADIIEVYAEGLEILARTESPNWLKSTENYLKI